MPGVGHRGRLRRGGIVGSVLIIGAGGVGNVVVRKCAAAGGVFERICLASRTVSKCEDIARDLGRKIETAAVDADNVGQVVELVRRFKPDLILRTGNVLFIISIRGIPPVILLNQTNHSIIKTMQWF